jgi:AAA15 family ATPase/GTPase
MLIQFSVSNFLSFKNNVTLSMVASRIMEHKDSHTYTTNNLRLLKSAVLYGANASGKSNLFKAMSFMSKFIRNSLKDSLDDEISGVEFFRLSTETEGKPSLFEMVFIINEVQYRYGFEVNAMAVVSEWLFYRKSKSEKPLFYREDDEFDISSEFVEGKGRYKDTRKNTLFLTVLASYNGEISSEIVDWFRQLNVISGLRDAYSVITTRNVQDELFKNEVVTFLKAADFGIDNLEVSDADAMDGDFEDALNKILKIQDRSGVKLIRSDKVLTHHKKLNELNQVVDLVKFEMNKQESEGTKKFYGLLGPIMDTLRTGKVLVIDELDAKLHPLITLLIINLFHSKEYNPYHAQLIFNSHDTNLLSKHYFRRDQIWFTEKKRDGSTVLESLMDYNIRNDASYEKDYLLGKYGSIPYIGSFDFWSQTVGEGLDGDG